MSKRTEIRSVKGLTIAIAISSMVFSSAGRCMAKGKEAALSATGGGEVTVDFAPTPSEIRAGKVTDGHLEEEGLVLHDEVVAEYVNRVAREVADAAGGIQHLQVKVVVGPVYNAFGVPGDIIYVSSELLQDLDSEDELASVLAHEVGHITARHLTKRQNKLFALQLTGYALPYLIPFGNVTSLGYSYGSSGVLSTYNKKAETEADCLGVLYLWKAGYDPRAFVSFLEKASKVDEAEGRGKERGGSVYPARAARIAKVKQLISTLPARSVASQSDSKIFAEIKSRLPIVDYGSLSSRLDVYVGQKNTPALRLINPQISRPALIERFETDERPPVMERQETSPATAPPAD